VSRLQVRFRNGGRRAIEPSLRGYTGLGAHWSSLAFLPRDRTGAVLRVVLRHRRRLPSDQGIGVAAPRRPALNGFTTAVCYVMASGGSIQSLYVTISTTFNLPVKVSCPLTPVIALAVEIPTKATGTIGKRCNWR